MTTHYTKYFRFPVPDFLAEPWVTQLSNTFDMIDAQMWGVQASSQLLPWTNSTTYSIGQVAIDPDFSTVWECQVAHVSAAAPTTFSQDRTANPTYWTFGVIAVADAVTINYNNATSGMASQNVQAAIDELRGTTIGDAPNDGKQYARQSQLWTLVASGGSGGGGGPPPSDAIPGMDDPVSGKAGTSTLYSRGDHIHPSDTTKAPVNNPSFTGVTISLGGPVLISRSGGYTNVMNGDGGAPALGLGGASNPTNFYNATTHLFRSVDGSSTFVGVTSAGMSLTGTLNVTGGGSFTVSPTAPTPTVGDSSNKVATTGFQVSNIADGIVTIPKIAAAAIATSADYWANNPNKLLTTDKVWGAAPPYTVADAATVTLDLSVAADYFWTIGNVGRTLANPINGKPGQKGIIYIRQDGTGNRTITSWGNQWMFSGGSKPVLSTAANAWDTISYVCFNSALFFAVFNKGYA